MNISAYPMTKRQSAKKDKIQRKYDTMTTLRSLAKFTSSSLKMSRNFHKRTHFEKKKKKNQGLWLRQWQKPNKSNRMLCLHKTAIKKSEILQYESRHHRIHCSFYFFILSLLFILFFFFSNQTHMHFPLNFTSRTITFAAGVMMNYGL